MKIPRPFAIAIDDMGWMDGYNEGDKGRSPFRLGINRKMTLADYQAVINLAERTGVRLQGLFILGELDKDGIAEKTPTVTGKNHWRSRDQELQNQIMSLVKMSSAHLEFGLHGVGHEFWPDDTGTFKRAEWYNLDDKEPWPEKSIRAHLDCFVEIMKQYGLTEEKNQSFPESFVPCAYSYYWNPFPDNHEYSLGRILSEYGVCYANTDFSMIPEQNPPEDGDYDNGVHVMNRFNFGNEWFKNGATPTIELKDQPTDFIEVHWPNLLAKEADMQEEVTSKWVSYFQDVNKSGVRYCSKNTAEHHSQFLYCKYSNISETENGIVIDNSLMPDHVKDSPLLQNLVLKFPLNRLGRMVELRLNGDPIPAYFEDDNYVYLYLPRITTNDNVLTFIKSQELPKDIVWHNTTCNIHKIEIKPKSIEIEARFYGTQKLTFLTKRQISIVKSTNSNLKIIFFEQITGGITILFNAANIQGETATLCLLV